MVAVPLNSELKRKAWMRKGLVQGAAMSFWNAYTGQTDESIVMQAKNENAAAGHTVVFDMDGNLSGRAVKGKDRAFGKGEKKKKFSDKVTVERFRLVVDNGDKFDGVDIGDLTINEHEDSREKLADLFVRWKDQALFDAAQGRLGQASTHIIDCGTSLDYNKLIEIERDVKLGRNFSTGSNRAPLAPFKTQDGKKIWLFVVDTAMATMIKTSAGYQNMVYNADIRGNNNRALTGVIGKVGSLVVVEADTFFGTTINVTGTGNSQKWGINDTSVEIAGLRQYDANGHWTGAPSHDDTGQLHSRGLILGAGALMAAFGKQPDYKHQYSDDFKITSESALETWCEFRKMKLQAEGTDYEAAKVAGIDYGVIAVDVEVQAA